MTPATLLDLARAKAAFQARTIVTILTEGRDMTETNPRELVNKIMRRALIAADQDRATDMTVLDAAADALTAALDRAEKAEAECRKQALEILSLYGQALDAIEARSTAHPPEASLDYDVIPDTPEQRAHRARHNAEMRENCPNLHAMLDDAT